MKVVILASLIGTAAAFGGGRKRQAPVAVQVGDPRSPDGLGVDPGPLDLFDPLGLAEDTESFARRRAVEIKHGRISMMAFIGMLVQELGITFPGTIDLKGEVPFADIGTGFEAIGNIPSLGLAQIVLFGGLADTVAMPSNQYTGGPQNLPGGYDGSSGTIPGGYPFTTQIEDVEQRTRTLNVEIQNGRAAMLGVTGCMIHSCLDSTDHHFFYPITHN
jgi:hypothetical protein